MRTRLDEIVEEELKRSGFANANQMRRYMDAAAERAFRHCKDQMLQYVPEWGRELYEQKIQPAPAGERCTTRCERGKGHEGQCSIPITNRRKGERRKGMESRAIYWSAGDAVGIWQGNSNMFWNRDRRSGVDRRSTSPSTGGKDRREG